MSLDETLLANHTTRGREIATRHNMAPPPRGRFSYAAVVSRSHWIQLCEAATPALGYASVVGEESDVKPAADKV